MRSRVAASAWMWVASSVLTIGSALGAGALYVAETNGQFDDGAAWIIVAGVSIAVAGLFSVPTSSGNRLTPAYIVIAALPLLSVRMVGDGGVAMSERILSLPGQFSALLAGLAALAVIRATKGDDPREVIDRFVRRLVVGTAYLFAYDLLATSTLLSGSEWRRLVLFALAGFVAFTIEAVVAVILTGRIFGGRLRHGLASSFSDGVVFVSLFATGALFGLAYEAIEGWALAVAVLPYAFTAGAFRRLAQTRRTYEQTLIALAQIPEVGGHTQMGHAARTNDLATAVAERIGVGPREYEHISYAAFLHDIGRITLNEPSILRQGFTDVDLAGWGAEIVGETKYLQEVSNIVRRQHEPFRSPGEVSNPDLPLASRIIKVCSAYDESVSELGFSPLEALERIHRGTVYDYDPDVVRELREVLERRGSLNHPALKPA